MISTVANTPNHSTESGVRPWLTVVLSAGQSRNPEKRDLELAIAELSAKIPGVEVLQIPHLYDLTKNSQSYQAMRDRKQALVVISWLFDRATHWVLDRNDVRGKPGEVLLKEANEDEDEDDEDSSNDQDEVNEDTVVHAQPRPDRHIYCIDFRASNSAQDFADEIARIAGLSKPAASQPLTLEMLARAANPTNDTYVGSTHLPITTLEETPGRRWYPVIDFSRCTNCMECIDFCLFGVYGVDTNETIVVEQADNCRKGCPACSRVCPQNAIMFPQHKTPAIAGAAVDAGSMKIDLSKLFGAPETNEDAAAVAARERDEQLILAGRAAVSETSEVSSTSRTESTISSPPNPVASSTPAKRDGDKLDQLLDQLDSLDL
ncbi:MAG: ferredoxin family protein [Pirellulales bacterium]